MTKYIDAEKVIAEIQRLNSLVPYDRNDRHDDGLHDAYKAVVDFINSLPEPKPFDLEKDVESWFFNEIADKINVEHIMYYYFQECARRYYELGKGRKVK